MQMLTLLLTDVLGVLPFCALGLMIGTLLKGQGAPGLLNMIYLPMAFLSGLWFPLQIMPKFLQQLAPIWPSYHLNALAMHAVGLSQAPRLPHRAGAGRLHHLLPVDGRAALASQRLSRPTCVRSSIRAWSLRRHVRRWMAPAPDSSAADTIRRGKVAMDRLGASAVVGCGCSSRPCCERRL